MHADAGLPDPESPPPSFIKRNGVVLGAIVGVVVVVVSIVVSPRILRHLETAHERDARIETVATHRPVQLRECEQRATAYYRKRSQYPTLEDGRDAVDVIRNRCARDPNGFR
jgi:hypothetical protein